MTDEARTRLGQAEKGWRFTFPPPLRENPSLRYRADEIEEDEAWQAHLLKYVRPPEPDAIPVVMNREITYWLSRQDCTPLDIPKIGPPEPLHRMAHRMADVAETTAKCYFIGGVEGLVKIGFSTNPVSRLASMQSGSPVDLSILALVDGGEPRERAYHVQFDAMRVRGEWFERHPDIMREIDRLNALRHSGGRHG